MIPSNSRLCNVAQTSLASAGLSCCPLGSIQCVCEISWRNIPITLTDPFGQFLNERNRLITSQGKTKAFLAVSALWVCSERSCCFSTVYCRGTGIPSTHVLEVCTNHRALFFVAPLFLLIVIAGCGGGGFNESNVTVNVSPASASVAASGQVTLQATVRGLCSSCPPLVTWRIVEQQTNGSSCQWQGATPPAGPCPDGTIQGADAPPALAVTYHAPSASGTFHVTAEWCDCFANPPVVKDATAAIIVQ